MKRAVLLFALLGLPAAGSAQAPRIAPRRSVVFAPGAPPAAPSAVELPETHWKTGALIGGVGVGLLGASAMYGLCGMESSDCEGYLIGGFLMGGLVGGVTGALVGGLFPEGPSAGE